MKKNTWKYRDKNDIGGEIDMMDRENMRQKLKRIDPWEAEEMLGVLVTVDNNKTKQIEKLQNTAHNFANNIKRNILTKNESWEAIKTTIMKILEYPMEAINLMEKEWNKIIQPIMQVALPKSSIVRTFPRDILHASKAMHGLDLQHPFYIQQIKHLTIWMEYRTANNITGQLLRSNIEQLKMELGINIKEYGWRSEHTKAYMTESWLTSLIKFCESRNIELQETTDNPEKCTTNDSYIMDGFIDQGYRNKDLYKLNMCRMLLKVITISHIVNTDRRQIDCNYLNGKFKCKF